jgi:hypothetical protein
MNRDFEIRQLLRAFRSGIMSEAAFEEELTRLEHEPGEAGQAPISGFEACGRSYRSEREAVLVFIDELFATQSDSAIAFAKWAAVCRTNGLRTGLIIAAERAAYHARVIQRRTHELGAELHSATTQSGAKLIAVLADGTISDLDKLAAITSLIQDPQQAAAPLLEFAAALNHDVETKEALRLLAEDELSTGNWLFETFAALNRQAQADNPASGTPAQAAEPTPPVGVQPHSL